MSKLVSFARRRTGMFARRGLLPVAVALPFAVPGVAEGAPRNKDGEPAVRYTREPRSVHTRAPARSKTSKSRSRPKKAAPAISGEDIARRKVATSLKVIDDLIETAKRLMAASSRSDDEYPDYAFRLANLHLDKRQIFDLQAGRQYELIHELQQQADKAKATQARAKQKRIQKMARQESIAAVRAFHEIVSDSRHAGYGRLDEALYDYATELGVLGKESTMLEAYARLVRDFPTSPFVPQAFLVSGDHQFAAGNIGSAVELYGKIVDGYPDSPVYAYALYKLGWCYLNPVGSTGTADYAHSLQSFVAAIKATNAGKAGSEANGAQLRREARRDLVKAYVHVGNAGRAWDFFGAIGNGPKPEDDMQVKMMELLADGYYGEGKYVESSAIYKTLQTERPDDDKTCRWQSAVVVNALATDDEDIQWKETQRLAGRWEQFRKGEQSKIAKKKCRADAHDALVQRATTWHDEAVKTKRDEPLALAEAAYTEFLRLFPKDRDAYEMSYYLGEAKWARAERLYESRDRRTQDEGRATFCEAAEAFIDTLQMKPKGKFTRDAAYAQMLGWKNCIEYDETGGRQTSCVPQSDGTCVYRTERRRRRTRDETTEIDAAKRFPVTPYSEKEENMLAAYDRYDEYVDDADDPELPKILYHRVKLMMDHHRFDEARPLLETLVSKFDGTRYSAWAAEMLIDVLTIRWADSANTPKQTIVAAKDARRWAEKIQTMKLWKSTEASRLREGVPRLVMSIRWKEAEANCEAGRQGDPEGFVDCGNEYYAIYEDYPDHDRSDELLYNAAIGFEAGSLLGNAIKLRNALLEHYPDSKLYKKTLREVAENYQAIAYYDQSADRLETYAKTYKGDDYAAQALNNAYLFRTGLGDNEAAKADLTRYEALFRRKDPKKAAGIYWSQSDLIEDAEDRLDHAEEYIARYGKKGGRDRLVVAHAMAGQVLWRRSCKKQLLADACVTLKRKKAMAGQKQRDEAADKRKDVEGMRAGKIPARCGSATRGVIVVHDRDAKLVARAQAHFDQAIAVASKTTIPADDSERAAAFHDAWAQSLMYRADDKYEQYLRIEMPTGLDFYVEDWKKGSGLRKWEREYAEQVTRAADSRKRFGEFLQSKRAVGQELLDAYGRIGKIPSPHWVLAAAARSAVVWQNFADQLYRAEVPRDIKTMDQYDTYCFALMDYAEPMEKKAVQAFEYCLDSSTKHQYFNEFSRMCEEEMQQREPDRFPATNEMFGTSRYTDARMDVVGVQTDLDKH